jgi:hypothetical protein
MILRRSLPTLGLLVVSFLAASLLIQSVHAATAADQNITVTPSSTALNIAPGSSDMESFDAINEGTNPFEFTVSSVPYYVEGVNYDPHFTQLPGTVNASKWVQFMSPTTQLLKGLKLASIDYTVTVPAGTPAGGYYAVLFAETSPLSTSDGVVSHNRVGDILYITVKGDIKTGGSVTAGSLPLVEINANVPLSLYVSNTGGTHFLTDTEMGVTSLFGKTIFHASSQRYVLPQTKREITATWTTNTPIGIYQVTRTSTVGGVVETLPVKWILIVQRWVLASLIIVIVAIITAIVLRTNRKRLKGQNPESDAV